MPFKNSKTTPPLGVSSELEKEMREGEGRERGVVFLTSKDTEAHTKYAQLVENDNEEDAMLWGYTPTRFEKNRSTAIHATMVLAYYLIVTVGLGM